MSASTENQNSSTLEDTVKDHGKTLYTQGLKLNVLYTIIGLSLLLVAFDLYQDRSIHGSFLETTTIINESSLENRERQVAIEKEILLIENSIDNLKKCLSAGAWSKCLEE